MRDLQVTLDFRDPQGGAAGKAMVPGAGRCYTCTPGALVVAPRGLQVTSCRLHTHPKERGWGVMQSASTEPTPLPPLRGEGQVETGGTRREDTPGGFPFLSPSPFPKCEQPTKDHLVPSFKNVKKPRGSIRNLKKTNSMRERQTACTHF